MLQISLILLHLISVLSAPVAAEAVVEAPAAIEEVSPVSMMFRDLGLEGDLAEKVFIAGHASVQQHGQQARILAIADMSQPSTAKRLYIIDMEQRRVLLRTYVAHGQNTGELMAKQFSNENDSHKTSLGLYRVGEQIKSPKHGAALLLYGLDKGKNCQALTREVIMHGADYVSDDFIKKNGRLGRSWGCPAVSRADMPKMIELLAGGGLLYIHG